MLNWGFSPTSFAYPYSDFNSTIEGIVQQCGYGSAREDGDLKSPTGCQSGCASAESIPPADPYAVRAPDSITTSWSLSDIENEVTQAEKAGGWMPLVFHPSVTTPATSTRSARRTSAPSSTGCRPSRCPCRRSAR